MPLGLVVPQDVEGEFALFFFDVFFKVIPRITVAFLVGLQMIAAYEAGSRKIPASMLPTLARLFSVSLEQLIGVEPVPTKRGPASVLQRQIEQIGAMPRAKQKFIVEMLEALIKQQQSA